MAAQKNRISKNEIYQYGNLMRKENARIEYEMDDDTVIKEVSARTKKNQRRAMKLGLGYIIFFAAAAAAVLFVAYSYLRVQAELGKKTRQIESLRTEITALKEKNTSEYHYIANSVNLEEIRDRAEELGMVYGDDSQIIEYQSSGDHEIRQYENIPEDGSVTGK